MKDCRLVVAGLLACAAWSGCRPGTHAASRPLAVVVSGDTAGWIVPCGCASNQSGGLPRRASYLERLRGEAEVMVADVGGTPSGTAAYDRLKFEAILRGELAMGIAAHNIGGPEARLGPDYLRGVAGRLGVPLVSANVSDRQGRPVAEPLRIIETGGRRVALVGVLGEQFATNELQVGPADQAVLETLQAFKGRYDVVVVLAYLAEADLRRLAETLPEADLVVGGPTGQPLVPVSIGPTLLASATNQGKFLARFDAPRQGSAGAWTGTVIELDERFSDDAQQLTNLREFYRELAERDFTPQETSFARPLLGQASELRVAGTQACRECHPEDCRLWDDSPHALAWDALQKKGAHVDPDCQRCHVTGYGLPGGFASAERSPELISVGCESCHGPSEQHAVEPKTRTAYYAQAGDWCLGCHDRQYSPQFQYDGYWAQIRHGSPPADAPGPLNKGGKTSEVGQ